MISLHMVLAVFKKFDLLSPVFEETAKGDYAPV
jgi:hypothetical protein